MKRFAAALLAASLLVAGYYFLLLRPDRDLLADLASDDPQVAVEAAHGLWLASRRGVDVGPILAPGLKHPSARVRARTLKTLDRLALARYSDDVAALLSDPEETVRIQAAVALRNLRGYSDPAPLVAVLRDRGQPVRIRVDVAWSLAERRAPGMGELFASLAADSTEPVRVRIEAVRSLGCLRETGQAGVVIQVARSVEEDTPLRRKAVEALSWLQTPESRHALLDLLEERSTPPLVRGVAAWSLGVQGRPEDGPFLEALMNDLSEPLYVQVQAARGLHELGLPVPGANRLIRRGLAAEDWESRVDSACLARELRALEVFDDLKAAAARETHAKAKCTLDDAVCRLQPDLSVNPDAALAP